MSDIVIKLDLEEPLQYNRFMAVTKIKQMTVVDQVMDQIKELISSGQYKPGDKIPTEADLADRFGIGRSSIRQAINIFNYLGVLESKASLGTFVQERAQISTEALTWSLLLGEDELEEMIDLRGSIELWCLIELTMKLAEGDESAREQIEKLEEIVAQMEKAAASNDKAELISLDFNFHHSIIEYEKNELYLSLYNTLKSFLYDEIKRTQLNYENIKLIPEEHGKLIDAMKTGNQTDALIAYQGHIKNIKYRLK